MPDGDHKQRGEVAMNGGLLADAIITLLALGETRHPKE
jgi:hypothetical protein